MWNGVWINANELAADLIDCQAISSCYQYLQVRFDAAIHIHDRLVDAERMHGPSIRTREHTHWIFHTQRHRRDNMRFEYRKVNQTGILHKTRDTKPAQTFCARGS